VLRQTASVSLSTASAQDAPRLEPVSPFFRQPALELVPRPDGLSIEHQAAQIRRAQSALPPSEPLGVRAAIDCFESGKGLRALEIEQNLTESTFLYSLGRLRRN
jgi:hypothetical protein